MLLKLIPQCIIVLTQSRPTELDELTLFDHLNNGQDIMNDSPDCNPIAEHEPLSIRETISEEAESDENISENSSEKPKKGLARAKQKSKKSKVIKKSTTRPMLPKKQKRENKGNNMERDVLRSYRKSISEYFSQNPHLRILQVPIKQLFICENVNKSRVAAIIYVFEFLGCRLQIWRILNQMSCIQKYQENSQPRNQAQKVFTSWKRGFSKSTLKDITQQLRGDREFDLDKALKESEKIIAQFMKDYHKLRRN